MYTVSPRANHPHPTAPQKDPNFGKASDVCIENSEALATRRTSSAACRRGSEAYRTFDLVWDVMSGHATAIVFGNIPFFLDSKRF